jgi:hypothetical protein
MSYPVRRHYYMPDHLRERLDAAGEPYFRAARNAINAGRDPQATFAIMRQGIDSDPEIAAVARECERWQFDQERQDEHEHWFWFDYWMETLRPTYQRYVDKGYLSNENATRHWMSEAFDRTTGVRYGQGDYCAPEQLLGIPPLRGGWPQPKDL